MMKKKNKIKTKRTFFGRIFRFFYKSVLYLLIFLFFLSVILYVTFRFETFRKPIVEYVVDKANSFLLAEVKLKDLRVHSLKYIQLKHLLIKTRGDTLLYAKSVNFNFNPVSFTTDKFKISRLKIQDGNIKFIRSGTDSLWNYNFLVKPSNKPKKQKEPRNLTINIKNIQFKRTNFIYRDSIKSIRINGDTSYTRMDYSDFEIQNLFTDIDAKLKLHRNDFKININEIKAKEKYSGFTLDDLKSDVNINEDGIFADNLNIQTPGSKININANLKNLNVFKKVDINKVIFDAELNATPIDVSDVLYFTDTGIKISNADKINIKTEGSLNNLNIKNLNIEHNDTDIEFSGYVKNILDINNFEYDFNFEKSKIFKNDVLTIIPDFREIIPNIDEISIKKLNAKGYLDSVFTDFDINTNSGNIKGITSINYNKFYYYADIETENLNIGQIIGNSSLNSDISGNIYINGSGLSLNNLKSEVKADIFNSSFSDYNNLNLKLRANSLKNNFFDIDTLFITKPIGNDSIFDYKSNVFGKTTSEIFADGWLDLNNENNPEYYLNVDLSAVNPSSLFRNENAPKYLSGNINISAKGLDYNKIEGNANFSLDEILFNDRVILPFDIKATAENIDSNNRNISIKSDYFDIDFKGKYNFDDIIETITFQQNLLTDFFMSKGKAIVPYLINYDNLLTEEKKKEFTFPEIDADLTASIKDISPVTAFIQGMDIFMESDLAFSIYSDSTISSINIDSIYIDNFEFRSDSATFYSDPLLFSGAFIVEETDSIPTFSQFGFNLEKSEEISFNENKISKPKIFMTLSKDDFIFNIKSDYNDIIKGKINGKISLISDSLISRIDTLYFDYNNQINIINKDRILLNYSENVFDFSKFRLIIDSNNVLSVKGKINENITSDTLSGNDNNYLIAENININFAYENINRFTQFIDDNDLKNKLKTFNAKLSELDLVINGNINNPDINLKSSIDNIELQGFKIGRIITSASLRDKNIFANTIIKGNNDYEYLRAFVFELPLNDNFSLNDSSEIEAIAEINELPLSLFSPFIPGIKEITGELSGKTEINGNVLKPEISGNLNFQTISVVPEANNLKYFGNGNVILRNDSIIAKNINLRNTTRDSERGKANIDAYIDLSKNASKMFDISINAKNFKVLGDASQEAMPNLYGDLIISTGDLPINFSGFLDDPILSGDININYADLRMPEFTYQEVATTQLQYEIKQETVRHRITNKKDSLIRLENEETTNIMDVMDFDLSVKMIGQVAMLIDLGALGEIYADVGTGNANEGLKYTKITEKKQENLTGNIILKDKSTFKSFKVLQTSGEISFPTGEIDNPSLDLEATYEGTTMIDNQPKNYTVKMFITGSQEQPNVRFTYFIDDIEATGDPKKIEEDAILLLIAGRTKNSSGSSTTSPDMLQQSLNSGISNYGSQLLTDFLIKTGSIQSVDLDFKGEGFDEAVVKFTGQTELFGGNVNWTIGGSLADFSANNEIILDVPLANYTENNFWRNFIFQFTRASHTNTTIQDQNAKNWEIKFKVGGSF